MVAGTLSSPPVSPASSPAFSVRPGWARAAHPHTSPHALKCYIRNHNTKLDLLLRIYYWTGEAHKQASTRSLTATSSAFSWPPLPSLALASCSSFLQQTLSSSRTWGRGARCWPGQPSPLHHSPAGGRPRTWTGGRACSNLKYDALYQGQYRLQFRLLQLQALVCRLGSRHLLQLSLQSRSASRRTSANCMGERRPEEVQATARPVESFRQTSRQRNAVGLASSVAAPPGLARAASGSRTATRCSSSAPSPEDPH